MSFQKALAKVHSSLIYLNKDFLVINKAPNVPTLPDRWRRDEIRNLIDTLKAVDENIFVVHRLDATTSGIIIFARNRKTHQYLNRLFQQRDITKKYWALTENLPIQPEGTIDRPLAFSNKEQKVIISSSGKQSVSHYQVLQTFRDLALLELGLETGRMHQLRVHLASLGTPIVNDSLYGATRSILLSRYKRNFKGKGEERPLMRDIALHARSLEFIAPNGTAYRFTAALPKDFQVTLKQLGKYA